MKMSDWFWYQRAKKRLEQKYNSLVAKARDRAERDQIEYEQAEAFWDLEEDRFLAEQGRVVGKAERLFIPRPATDEANTHRPRRHDQRLIKYKPEVLKRLRDEVRKEQAARRQWLVQFAPLVIGLIGALSGLIAVWHAAR